MLAPEREASCKLTTTEGGDLEPESEPALYDAGEVCVCGRGVGGEMKMR